MFLKNITTEERLIKTMLYDIRQYQGMGMCCCEGYVFQPVLSGIGYRHQRVFGLG